MATWATYWSGPTATEAEGEPIDHVASDQFGKAGVTPGDTMYVVSYVDGRLHVVTALVVGNLVRRRQAEEILKRTNLWDAEWHVVARSDSVRRATMSAPLTNKQTAEMVFINQGGEGVSPARNRQGAIDPQTFRTTRRIDRRTAAMLNQILTNSRLPVVPGDSEVT